MPGRPSERSVAALDRLREEAPEAKFEAVDGDLQDQARQRGRLEQAGITNVEPLLAHPGLASTPLQSTTGRDGGMDVDSPFMQQARSAEDGALGIIGGCMDPQAEPGNFYGPKA